MALKIKLNTTQRTNTPAQPYTAQAVELMQAIRLCEQTTAKAVTTPGEVFAVLLGMGYTRADQMDIQSKAGEFVTSVRNRLTTAGRKNPSYDEVLSVMNELGYSRAA